MRGCMHVERDRQYEKDWPACICVITSMHTNECHSRLGHRQLDIYTKKGTLKNSAEPYCVNMPSKEGACLPTTGCMYMPYAHMFCMYIYAMGNVGVDTLTL
jgi:hypothetical protein